MNESVAIERITAQNAAAFEEIRLRALQESPTAFASTYEQELGLSEADWRGRVEKCSGADGIGFLAFDGAIPCGLVRGSLDDTDPRQIGWLESMWVAPTHRRRGVGRQLVDKIVEWASGQHLTSLMLDVTTSNQAAIRFYECLGFVRTGRRKPYPNDLALQEDEMRRMLADGKVC